MDEHNNFKLLTGDQPPPLAHPQPRLHDPRQPYRDTSEASVLPKASNYPHLTAAWSGSFQSNPSPFATAIFPVMMPSVRQTLAEAFKSLREFLNAQETRLNDLHHSLTLINKAFLPRFQSQLQTLTNDLHLTKELLNKQEEILHLLTKRCRYIDEQLLPNLQTQLETLNKQFHQHLPPLTARLQNLEPICDQLLTFEQNLQTLPSVVERIEQLEKIKQRFLTLENRLNDAELLTQELATFLPDAIRQATEQAQLATKDTLQQNASSFLGVDLTESLQQPVTQCIKKSIQEDTNTFANALFPVMGPAIRKSINESLKSLIQTINHSIEQSLSPQGIAWRLEAIRTGQSFADIVLQKTIVYQVDQVFLIHKESGLLIQHLHRENIKVGDSDAVSAMLTAIQDFTRDSFSVSKEEELDSINVGQFTVWVERGPYAILACVIRGIAPYKLRETMRETLEIIHARYGRHLEHFNGDPTPLDGCRSFLNKTLQAELKPDAKKEKKPLFSPTFIAFGFLTIGIASWWGFSWWERVHLQHQKFETYLHTLRHTAGLVVIESNIENNILKIRGLRDPLAEDPFQIAQQQQLDLNTIAALWSPYQTLAPEFILKRLQLALSPPPSVQLYIQNNQLVAKGYANTKWLNDFEHYTRLLLGILEVDRSQLLEFDAFLLQKLQTTLKPPASVQLEIKNAILYLKGHAPAEWIKTALITIENFKEIQAVKTEQLLETDHYLQQYAIKVLTPPERVSVQVKNAILTIQGYTKKKDYLNLLDKIKQLQGFSNIEYYELIDIETEAEQLITKIEKTRLYFSDNADFSNHHQVIALNSVAKDFQQLLKYSTFLAKSFHLKITGHTDGLGTQYHNLQVSKIRAETVHNKLQELGISPTYLVIGKLEKLPFGESKIDLEERAVTFTIVEKSLP